MQKPYLVKSWTFWTVGVKLPSYYPMHIQRKGGQEATSMHNKHEATQVVNV